MVVRHLVLCTLGLIPMVAMMFGSILIPDWPRNPRLKGLVLPGIMALLSGSSCVVCPVVCNLAEDRVAKGIRPIAWLGPILCSIA